MNVEVGFDGAAPLERDIRPIVGLPRSGIPGLVIALVAAVLAILLFTVLENQRKRAAVPARQSDGAEASEFAPPPVLVVPPVALAPAPTRARPKPGPPSVLVQPRLPRTSAARIVSAAASPLPQQVVAAPPMPAPFLLPAVPPAPPEAATPSGSEPALVIDSGGVASSPLEAAAKAQDEPRTPSGEGPKASVSRSPAKLANLTTSMATGTMIAAVLETPIDTSRPGYVRAIVSQDARGFDGRRVLVPRGSRLVGECQGQIKSGQSRVLVNWTRVILPDGRTFELDSPAADSLGGSGVPGHVNSFFLARFFNSALQTALYVGESLIGRGRTTVLVGLPNGAATNIATQISSGPQAKIKVASGALINVYVAHDIDFGGKSAGR